MLWRKLNESLLDEDTGNGASVASAEYGGLRGNESPLSIWMVAVRVAICSVIERKFSATAT